MKKITTVPEIREAYERRNSVDACREVVEELHDRLGIVLVDNNTKDQQIATLERELEELKSKPTNGAVQPSKAKRHVVKLKRPQGNRLWDWPHIHAMRQAYLEGKAPTVIARFYGSSRGHMTKILQNQAWYDPNYDPGARKKVEA